MSWRWRLLWTFSALGCLGGASLLESRGHQTWFVIAAVVLACLALAPGRRLTRRERHIVDWLEDWF